MPLIAPPPKLNTAQGAAPSYSARAWVNFNGIGTVAIRASANVSSVTDNGAGNYSPNFTNDMPDANYAVVVTAGDASGIARFTGAVATSAAKATVRMQDASGSAGDYPNVYVAIFR